MTAAAGLDEMGEHDASGWCLAWNLHENFHSEQHGTTEKLVTENGTRLVNRRLRVNDCKTQANHSVVQRTKTGASLCQYETSRVSRKLWLKSNVSITNHKNDTTKITAAENRL